MEIQHIAIIMDGNGRWASQRNRPRTFGHQAGVKTVRAVIEACIERGIPTLSLFAFSSENWNRPKKEVQRLMDLFLKSLKKEFPELYKQGVCLKFLGDVSRFSDKLQVTMQEVQGRVPETIKLNLNVAVNYGGRWDIVQAARALADRVAQGALDPAEIDEAAFAAEMSGAQCPDPDILIRTGGDFRVSNFMLWQLAYSELFFLPTLWPDFSKQDLHRVCEAFQQRERRFGRVKENAHA